MRPEEAPAFLLDRRILAPGKTRSPLKTARKRGKQPLSASTGHRHTRDDAAAESGHREPGIFVSGSRERHIRQPRREKGVTVHGVMPLSAH
jgi:hypothetical protein